MESNIQNFYDETNIFITGATGFVGKALIEKLLRDTNVNRIYILIREKRGRSIKERLEKMFENPIFSVIRSHNPKFEEKIVPIIGECGIKDLGISSADQQELINKVHIIFHGAATVNFDENLKTAYDINVNGIKTVIEIAKKMKHLKSVVFVSTAYSNCIRNSIIEEKVYQYSYDEPMEKLENMSKETAIEVKEKMMGEWPNTYTYTKSLAEMLVEKEKDNIPIGIFRPSIITSSYKEPIPAWIDNVYAINGISLGLLTGFLRVYPGRSDIYVDIIPIDMCVSAMIACAMEIGQNHKKSDKILVYNYTSRLQNPVTYGLFEYLNLNFGVPTIKAIWKPCGIFCADKKLSRILSFFLEIIPAVFLDGAALATGNKPQLLSLYSKVLKLGDKVKFFGERDWEFDNENVQNLWLNLNKNDQKLFPFNIASISWVLFSKNYSLGLRRYVLKEDDSTLEKAWKKHNRLTWMHLTLQCLAAFLLSVALYLLLSKMHNLVFN
ncbi:fatty acyl-CoA reductase wat-like [Anthonomus grandis grandis]|uniref:fatty acyl-CoA reductase wat-like n=1 Tax=Anthonomus grandis grandis TaxID=2921223 RepID=UPI0021659D34|nr:fatty acyl-CoA reductase wat-like [Anthonomus grandis grandis]XP_050298926.1 fatty acyl-CoA reductase wat-like [Anthonomus grandis grandis]